MVTGRVTLDGEPITEGNVGFFSTELGVGSEAPIAADGTYALPGELQAGEYTLTVRGLDPIPDEPPPKPTKIPKSYWQATTSGLTLTIAPGENHYDIELQK